MGYHQMTRNVESIFGAVVTAPNQIPYTYTATGGETFISLPFYPVTGVITINGGVQVPVDNYEIDGNTVNLGRALEAGDVVYCLFDKVLSPEDYEDGIRIYKFQAVGTETSFTPDFTTYGVQSLYIDGKYQVPETDYRYNRTTGVVTFLNGSPAAGKWVVAEMSIRENRQALSEVGGAGTIGTESGQTVQEALNQIEIDLANVDGTLRQDLAKIDGYNLIGELGSVADFVGLTGIIGSKVQLRSWYANTTIGGGTFYFDAALSKSKHDGGKYISPTVPYTTATDFVLGVGETDTSGLGVWVRSGVVKELRTEWYGMQSGTDVTTVLNKIANTAGVEAYGITVAPGNFTLTGQVSVNADGSPSGNVRFFRGAGKRGTVFTVNVASTTGPTLLFIGSIGSAQAGFDGFTISNLKIRGNGTDAAGTRYTGTGLYVQNMHTVFIHGFHCENLNRGLLLQNSLYVHLYNGRANQCREAMLFRRNGLTTGANAVQITRVDFADNVDFCVHAIESHSMKFQTCSFEGNGARLSPDGTVIVGTACVQTESSGASGGVVAIYDNCYFESNKCADIIHLVNINREQAITVTNCVFNKGGTGYTDARIRMVCQLSTMTTKAILILQNNRALSVAGTDADTKPDVSISGFANTLGYGHADFVDYDNTWSSPVPNTKDAYVVHKKSPDDGFIGRISSAGAVNSILSRNVVSCTRQAVGVYRIVTNQLTSNITFNVELDNLGFVLISTAENNESVTISTFNSAGVAADVGFRIIGKRI